MTTRRFRSHINSCARRSLRRKAKALKQVVQANVNAQRACGNVKRILRVILPGSNQRSRQRGGHRPRQRFSASRPFTRSVPSINRTNPQVSCGPVSRQRSCHLQLHVPPIQMAAIRTFTARHSNEGLICPRAVFAFNSARILAALLKAGS